MSRSFASGLRLPIELCEYIIDLLRGDRETLKSCSLTCRLWVDRSQQHLHRFIRVSARHNAIPLVERYTHPRLTQYVRKVLVVSEAPATSIWPTIDALPLREDMWYFTLRFPNIEKLGLMNIKWTHAPLEVRSHLLSSKLRSLSIRSLLLTEADAQTLFSFISMSPRLTSLAIGAIHWESDLPSTPLWNVTPSVRLDQLTFDFVSWSDSVATSIAAWLSIITAHGSVKCVVLYGEWDANIILYQLLRAIGPAAIDLRLLFSSFYGFDVDNGIEHCTHLRALTVSVENFPGLREPDRFLSLFLPQVVSRNLGKISLKFRQYTLVRKDIYFAGLGLDYILSEPPFDKILDVEFVFVGGDVALHSSAVETLRETLPRIFSEKIVSFLYPSYEEYSGFIL